MGRAAADLPLFGRDGPGVAWRPDATLREESRLAGLVRGTGMPDLEALQRRAMTDPAWFWGAAADDLGVAWQRRPTTILDASGGPEWTRWWLGGAFNYAAAAVDPRAARDPDGNALTWEGEDGAVVRLTNAELKAAVDRAAGMLAHIGIRAGDRIGIYLPFVPETVIAVLAAGRLGAVYTPIFSGYGAPAAASRLADCDARLLITADGFYRRGSVVPLKETADAAVALAPTVERVLVVRRLGERLAEPVPWTPGRDLWWDAAIADPAVTPLAEAPETDPNAPCLIIYTSGTTGRPKGAVHPHGGFPLKAAQDLAHLFDLRAGDRLFWFTDLGWMMGPWAIAGAFLLGASLVIYEGAPDFPGPDRVWSIAARHRVTHLGLSPTVVRALLGHGTEPVRSHDLSALRVLGSTGEPWNPDPWWWFFREVGGGRIPLINYSGGTEVSGGIVGSNVLTPIKPAGFGGPNVGCAADVLDADGAPVRGAVGELANTAPLPGMTRGFWNDRERYLDAYWRRVPGTWIHGDWAIVDDDGHWFIQGRSDDTLKIAGKRVGPAEVESAAVGHPAVAEAAAIGVPHAVKGETIVLICVLRRGVTDDPDLRAAIATRVASEMGKALRPETVVCVAALPKTRSGKVMRRVARAVWLGRDPGDISTLEDPATIAAIRAVAPPAAG
ncbi:MAG: AMP-binding protein [Chloroflexota bacterium]